MVGCIAPENIHFLCCIVHCLVLFSGCLPSQDKSVGIICLGLESLIPIMSTRALYKQLGEVGGVLRLTSASQLYLHSKKKKKKSQSPFYPSIASIASKWLTAKPLCKHRLSISATTTTIRTHEAHICSATHTHTGSAALKLSLSNFLTAPHTLICTSSLNSHPVPLLWMLPCSADDLSHSLTPSIPPNAAPAPFSFLPPPR